MKLNNKGASIGEVMVSGLVILIIVGILVFLPTGDINKTREILEAQGIKELDIERSYAPRFRGCSEGDSYGFLFQGIQNNRQVTGIVCGGLWKGYTVRYF